VPAVEREEILKRAELARRELRLLAGDGLSAQGKQRLGWVIHDLDVIVASTLQEILDDVEPPRARAHSQRDLLG
jgi:hypothetical protein